MSDEVRSVRLAAVVHAVKNWRHASDETLARAVLEAIDGEEASDGLVELKDARLVDSRGRATV